VKFATPVMKHGNGHTTYSWGYYYTKLVYAETLDQAVDDGLKWVSKCRDREKQNTDS
jgi:hypothetical protein